MGGVVALREDQIIPTLPKIQNVGLRPCAILTTRHPSELGIKRPAIHIRVTVETQGSEGGYVRTQTMRYLTQMGRGPPVRMTQAAGLDFVMDEAITMIKIQPAEPQNR